MNPASGTNEGKLWGGRFVSGPSPELEALSRSTHFDWRLTLYDIAGSHAHAKALAAAGLLSADEERALHEGLDVLTRRYDAGELRPDPTDEDVHGALERLLIAEVGEELGGRLRAGRSRNDQIATLLRTYLLDQSLHLADRVLGLVEALATQAQAHLGAVMPGRTHLQHAQPVLLSHHLLAHAWPLLRDVDRLDDWRRRTAAESPYGGGALAGNSLGLDPLLVAVELGFDGVSHNSIDGTSARDFAAEFAYVTAQIGVDVSRLAEELILWSTREFGFVRLHDSWSTGSSIMPQKKNPDIAELARGKAGRLIGDLTGLLATLKGLPLAYNRDLQEDKEPVFNAIDTVRQSLTVFAAMLRQARCKLESCAQAVSDPALLATDLADYLVMRGVPFRKAHEIVGRAVALSAERGLPLSKLPLAEYRALSESFADDLYAVFDLNKSMSARRAIGAPSPENITAQIARWRTALELASPSKH